MTKPVLVATSQATRLRGSCSKQESRTASAIWSQSLSGWPSVTDSEVKSSLGEDIKVVMTYPFRKRNCPSGSKGQIARGARLPSHLPDFLSELAPSAFAVVVEV